MKTNVCEWALAATLALCPLLSPAQSTGGGTDGLYPSGRSISVNVRGGTDPNKYATAKLDSIDSKTGMSGLVRVLNSAWNEADVNKGSVSSTSLKDNRAVATTAAATVAVAGVWHFTKKNYANSREALLGWMGMGYAEATSGDEIVLSDVPYGTYDVILYMGTDHTDLAWAPVKVTDATGGVAYYYYPSGATDEAATRTETTPTEEAPLTWGATNDIGNANLGSYGHDVMRITGLSGNVSIDIGTHDGTHPNSACCGLCGFQIVEMVPSSEVRPVMSLNFADGGEAPVKTSTVSNLTGNFGLEAAPAATWMDLTGADSAAEGQTVTTLFGEPHVADWTGATVTWSSANTWSYKTGQVSDDTEPFLKTYLDDGGDGASVTVANVPFEAYDVIVYNATDSGSAFKPVTINGTQYTWDAMFGTVIAGDATDSYGSSVSGLTKAVLGQNALRVDGQTARTLEIKEPIGDSNAVRACLAAVQIVGRRLITVSGERTWADLSAGLNAADSVLIVFEQGATVTGDVTLPADAIVDLEAYDFAAGTPFAGTLTLNAGSTLRLPEGFSSGKIASSLVGTLGAIRIDGMPAWLSLGQGEEAGMLKATYLWTDMTGNHLWSDPGNWSSLIVPNASSEVIFELAASRPETVIFDVPATVASVTIERHGDGEAATLTFSAQEGGALTVSGQMLTTGNVAVTQNADITVNGTTTTVQMDMGGGQTMAQPGQAGFHVDRATYTVASGATLAVPATEGASTTGEVGMSNGATVTVAEGATLTAKRTRVTYYGGKPSGGTLNLGGSATFTRTLTLNTENYTVNLASGTLTTPSVSLYEKLLASGNATLVGAMTFSVSGSNAQTLSGAGNLTLTGEVTFGTTIGEAYTGEITVADDASVTLGEGRPKLTTLGAAQVSVTPSAEEQTRGRVVFPTSMTEEPTGATFTIEGVSGEEVSVAVADGELTLSWGTTLATLATSGNWSATAWTIDGVAGQPAPTKGVVVLDGTGAPLTVTLDTAVPEAITQILVQGTVNLVTTAAQPTIPAAVAFAEGVTLGVGQTSGAGMPKVKFAAPWQMNSGMTLDIQGPFDFANSATLSGYNEVGGDLRVSADGVLLVFMGGLRVVGSLAIAANNVTIEGLYMVLGDTLTLEGDAITLKGTGNGFSLAELTSVTSNGANNAILNVTDACPLLTVSGGSLVYGDDSSKLKGVLVADGATLRLAETWKTGQTLHVAAEAGATNTATLDLSAIAKPNPMVEGEEALIHKRPVLARYDGSQYALPATVKVTPTPKEQEADRIVIDLVNGNPGPKLSGEIAITDETWVPIVSSTSTAITIRNVPGAGVAGLDAEVERLVREAARDALAESGLSAYTVEVRTRGRAFGADDGETAGLLAGALACFETEPSTDIVSGADGAAESCVVFVAYDFGIAGIAANASGGLDVTVKAQANLGGAGAEAAPLPFREGATVEVLCGDAVVGSATAAAGNGGTLTATLATAPEGVLSVRVSGPGEAAAQAN